MIIYIFLKFANCKTVLGIYFCFNHNCNLFILIKYDYSIINYNINLNRTIIIISIIMLHEQIRKFNFNQSNTFNIDWKNIV